MTRIVIFTRLRAAPGRGEALRALFEPLLTAAAAEPGTVAFAVHAARDDPDQLLCYEVYTDDEALAQHRGSRAVRDAVGRFDELLDAPPVVTYAQLLGGHGVPSADPESVP